MLVEPWKLPLLGFTFGYGRCRGRRDRHGLAPMLQRGMAWCHSASRVGTVGMVVVHQLLVRRGLAMACVIVSCSSGGIVAIVRELVAAPKSWVTFLGRAGPRPQVMGLGSLLSWTTLGVKSGVA